MAYGNTEIGNTHFAITSVNVPDRLDMQDMDDRKQDEDDSRRRRFDFSALRAWAPRMLVLAVVVGVVFILFEGIDAWRSTLSAERLSQTLSASLGVPVRIESTSFSFSPSPRLVLQKVEIDHKLSLGEISINVGTKHIAQGFQGHGWNFGEAVIAPTALTLEQCRTLVALLPKLGDALPHSLSSLRFDQLEISGQPWFAGSWSVIMLRNKSTAFPVINATQRHGDAFIQFDVTPTADPQTVGFQMEAKNWVLPFGPQFPVEVAVASGTASAAAVNVEKYSIGGGFGAVQGHVAANRLGAWTIDALAETEGLDLEGLIRIISTPKEKTDEAASETSPMIQGTASFSGHIEGTGATLQDAAATAVFRAPVHVRWPILNGVNLGYAAMRPGSTGGTSGGTTRFSTLNAVLVVGPKQVTLKDIQAHAGALATFGQVNMAPDHSLSGMLRVDLGATRVLAPIRVAVHGTLQRPEFGR